MVCTQRSLSARALISGANRHLVIAAAMSFSLTPLFAQAYE